MSVSVLTEGQAGEDLGVLTSELARFNRRNCSMQTQLSWRADNFATLTYRKIKISHPCCSWGSLEIARWRYAGRSDRRLLLPANTNVQGAYKLSRSLACGYFPPPNGLGADLHSYP